MNAHVELELTGPLDHLRIAWQIGEALLEDVPFADNPEQTRYNTLVAVQEMLTNVLRYAVHDDSGAPIRLGWTASAAGVTVEIRDQGESFDPLAAAPREVDEDVMPEQAGGYGIMITRWVMDQVDYERRDGWNVLRLTKMVAEPALQLDRDEGALPS